MVCQGQKDYFPGLFGVPEKLQKENCKNRFGDAFIETFYAFHTGFNPPEKQWTMDYESQFRKVDPDWYLEEVFIKGDADISLSQCLRLPGGGTGFCP